MLGERRQDGLAGRAFQLWVGLTFFPVHAAVMFWSRPPPSGSSCPTERLTARAADCNVVGYSVWPTTQCESTVMSQSRKENASPRCKLQHPSTMTRSKSQTRSKENADVIVLIELGPTSAGFLPADHNIPSGNARTRPIANFAVSRNPLNKIATGCFGRPPLSGVLAPNLAAFPFTVFIRPAFPIHGRNLRKPGRWPSSWMQLPGVALSWAISTPRPIHA